MVVALSASILGNELILLLGGHHTMGAGCAVIDETSGPAPIVRKYFTESQPYTIIPTQGVSGEPLRGEHMVTPTPPHTTVPTGTPQIVTFPAQWFAPDNGHYFTFQSLIIR